MFSTLYRRKSLRSIQSTSPSKLQRVKRVKMGILMPAVRILYGLRRQKERGPISNSMAPSSIATRQHLRRQRRGSRISSIMIPTLIIASLLDTQPQIRRARPKQSTLYPQFQSTALRAQYLRQIGAVMIVSCGSHLLRKMERTIMSHRRSLLTTRTGGLTLLTHQSRLVPTLLRRLLGARTYFADSSDRGIPTTDMVPSMKKRAMTTARQDLREDSDAPILLLLH